MRGSMATRRCIASSGTPPSASSIGFVMSTGSPAATQSSRTTSGSASGADRRCSCRWRILRGMHRRISARRSLSSMASNRRPISSSWTCRRATHASCGPIPQRRRRPGWMAMSTPSRSSEACRCRCSMTMTAAWSRRSCLTGHVGAPRCSVGCNRTTCFATATGDRAKAMTRATPKGSWDIPGGTSWFPSRALPVGKLSTRISRSGAASASATSCGARPRRSAHGCNAIWRS